MPSATMMGSDKLGSSHNLPDGFDLLPLSSSRTAYQTWQTLLRSSIVRSQSNRTTSFPILLHSEAIWSTGRSRKL